MTGRPAHPWMANSSTEARQEMLAVTGAASIAELFQQIPADHRLKRPLDLPPQLASEMALKRHLVETLGRNSTCETHLNFLGSGCWQHHVPAVVDEIVGRAEFLTSVWGSPQSDHGRNQAWFEYASQMGELLDMDVVQLPVYSWGCAIGHAVRMAARITGRREVLIPAFLDPERRAVLANYCEPPEMASHIGLTEIAVEPKTGRIDLADLKAKLTSRTAAVYLENPSSQGVIETAGEEIARLAHAAGAEFIVGADPISLGILRPPSSYGADLAVGPTQPLGVHMNCGGGSGGYIASRDEEKYVRQYNGFLVSITGTAKPGEFGFALASSHQTSYGMREEGRDWTGNSVYLWAIANAVYLSLLGPQGLREAGERIIANTHYALRTLNAIAGVSVPVRAGVFKEFRVNFDRTGKTVAAINRKLARAQIFGGKDLSQAFPQLGQSALYCVTEVHSRDDIDRLAAALKQAVS